MVDAPSITLRSPPAAGGPTHCQLLSWAGEGTELLGVRTPSSSNKPKMKVIVKPLISYHNGISKSLNWRKCWLLFHFSPWKCSWWRGQGRCAISCLLREPWTKGFWIFKDLRRGGNANKISASENALSIEAEWGKMSAKSLSTFLDKAASAKVFEERGKGPHLKRPRIEGLWTESACICECMTSQWGLSPWLGQCDALAVHQGSCWEDCHINPL